MQCIGLSGQFDVAAAVSRARATEVAFPVPVAHSLYLGPFDVQDRDVVAVAHGDSQL